MRNFIDIINQSLTQTTKAPTKASILSESVLLEGKHYEAMFNGLDSLVSRYGQDHLAEEIASCKEVVKALKRNDRQAWAARILRAWLIHTMSNWQLAQFYGPGGPEAKQEPFNAFKTEVARLDAKYRGEYAKTLGVDFLADLQNTPQFGGNGPKAGIKRFILNHYLGMPFSKIQNYVFSKTMHDTLVDLSTMEAEYKERSKGLLALEEGDKIIIRMPENFVWVMLARGYCDKEASAMGHCGNAGARHDDHILSLRRVKDTIDGVAYMEVFLTFILNGDGYLGEMKGRGNDKPAERYHPQIIELLRNPIVKGIRGGGYMPKNNFNLGDLPDDVREKLLDEMPHLGGWQARLQKAQKSGGINKEFMEAFQRAIQDSNEWTSKATIVKADDEQLSLSEDFGSFVVSVHSWPQVDDFIEEMTDDEHTIEVAKGEYNVESYDTPGDDRLESLIDSMPTRWQIALGKHVRAQMEANDVDEDELEDFDMSSSREVVEKLDEYDSNVKNALESAVITGDQYGAESEAHDALMKAVKGFTPQIGKLVFKEYDRDGEKGWIWDAPVSLMLSLADAAKLVDESVDNGDEYEYGDDRDLKTVVFGEDEELKISQPYYGYSDFDEDAAMDRFYEEVELDDLEPSGARPPMPNFDDMDIGEIKDWISTLYAEIPDGFIRKVHPDTLPDDRIRASAKGLYKTYYGS
jgi:hypothetical protein